jgi:hypothetical protein
MMTIWCVAMAAMCLYDLTKAPPRLPASIARINRFAVPATLILLIYTSMWSARRDRR